MSGFCSLAFRNLPLERALSLISSSGFQEVEIWYPHVRDRSENELKRIKHMAGERGMSFTVLSPYFCFTQGKDRSRESLSAAVEILKAARLLGIRKIRTFVDVGPDGLPSAMAEESDWKAARDGLRALCAMDSSMEFVLETHENTLADTLPSVQRLLAEVEQPNFTLNAQATQDFLKRGYLECLEVLWPHISHLHLQQVLPDGRKSYIEDDGIIDFAQLAEFLNIRHYSGTASVEYCWPDPDPQRAASAARFLKKINL